MGLRLPIGGAPAEVRDDSKLCRATLMASRWQDVTQLKLSENPSVIRSSKCENG